MNAKLTANNIEGVIATSLVYMKSIIQINNVYSLYKRGKEIFLTELTCSSVVITRMRARQWLIKVHWLALKTNKLTFK